MKKLMLPIVLATAMLYSCNQPSGKILDTPTSGSIKILADESLRPLVEAEVETFNGIYAKANISVEYMSEADVMDAFMKDSVKLAIVARGLLPEEKKYFSEIETRVYEVPAAVSAIAAIVHPSRTDTLMSTGQLASMLRGDINNWSQLGSKSKNGIEIVFDNPSSGLIRYLKDSIAKVEKLPANCFAVENNEAVVDHVSKNENSLGLIGVEWISDDPASNKFLDKIKVVSISGDSTAFLPYQAYLALKCYPLMRTVTILNRDQRTGLPTGFSRFVISERGQRIVLKTGLLPKKMPIRLVQVNPKPFDIEKD